MAEELKRNDSENVSTVGDAQIPETMKTDNSGHEIYCGDVDTQCIMSHICYQYSSMVMAGLIEALNYFAGNQGPKVLVRILAKNIPMQIMDVLGIDAAVTKNMSENDIMTMLPDMIAKKGGPKIKIEKNDGGEYKFTLNECHFLPYSKSKGFCSVTAGLMLGLAQFLSKKPMDIEEIHTIARGDKQCEFAARLKKI